jgi:uncharacterized protein (DUF58 family)
VTIPKEMLTALRRIEIITRRKATSDLAGSYASRFRGQGMIFREVRAYQQGDEVRTIDWNVSARTNETHVKVFSEEREMTVMLLVDTSASMLFGTTRVSKIELTAELCALFAFSASKNQDRVGLICQSDKPLHPQARPALVPPQKGEPHVLRIIRKVLTFQAAAERTEALPRATAASAAQKNTLAPLLETLLASCRKRSVAFVISDFLNEDYERSLALARTQHDVIPVVLSDLRDEVLPDVGLLPIFDPESGETVWVDSGSAAVRSHYNAHYRARTEKRRALFRKLGLRPIELRTDEAFVRAVRSYFLARKGLG